MMKKISITKQNIASLLSGCILASASMAAQGEDLMNIYQLAMASDPSMQGAEHDRKTAYESRPQALSRFLPTISAQGDTSDVDFASEIKAVESGVNFGRLKASDDFNKQTYTVSLSQPVFHYENHIGWQQSDNVLAQADGTYEVARQDLVMRTAKTYFDVLIAGNNLDFSRVEKQATSRHLEQTKKRYEVGLIASTDVSEAKARYDISVADEIAAENQVADKTESLRELTAQYHQDLAGIGIDMPLVSPDPEDIDQWTQVSLRQNPTIVVSNEAAELARKQVKMERAGHFPYLDVIMAHNRTDSNDGGSNDAISETKTTTNTMGLQLTIPIFQGGYVNSKTREAIQKYQKAQTTLDKQRRTVVSQTRQAYLGVMASISRVKALQQAVTSSKDAQAATQAGFEVGTRTIIDVLDSQRDHHRRQRDLNNEKYSYILKTLALKQAAGSLAEDDLHTINSWLVAATEDHQADQGGEQSGEAASDQAKPSTEGEDEQTTEPEQSGAAEPTEAGTINETGEKTD